MGRKALPPGQKKANDKAREAKWRSQQKEKLLAGDENAIARRDRKKAVKRAWAEANRERVAAIKRAYNLKNRERDRSKNRARADKWAIENIDRHRELRRASAARWQRNNPEKVAIFKSRAHARRKSKQELAGFFTLQEWKELLDRTGHKCVSCGISEAESIYRYPRKGFPLKGKLTVDHIIPLSKGGAGTIDNIAPMCLPCNCKKHDKPWEQNTVILFQGESIQWVQPKG